MTACGNGVTTAGEVCDDGNATEGDGCDSNCTPTACGNGVVSPSVICDDRHLVNGDGCDATFKPTGCGSGVRTGSEACDDGNLVAGDGCEANCTITPISESVGAGGRVTTDSGATGATEMVPLQSSVTTPTGGTVQISTTTDIETEKGFEILGIPVEINAPDATAANPLVIEIEVDASLIPEGVTLDRLHVLRDGKAVDDCTGAPGVAEPDPCMALRETQPDGDAMLTVLTSEASQWAAAIAGQSKDDQKCVLSLAKAALKVAKTQLKEGEKCVKFGAKGKEPDPQTCLTADAKGKIAKAVSKVEATATKKCSATPPFGIAGTAAVSAAAQAEELGLIADLFGSDLNVAVISSDDRDGSKCQSKVLKDAQKHLDTQVRLFERCAKDGLKGKPELMLTAADLEVCFAVVAADEKSKVAKSLAKIAKTLTKCPADLVPVLPAGCGAAGDVAACIAEQASCRFCRLMNAIHDVDVDCDTYDDGESDGSCS